jgi:hypothetical protein
MKNDFETMKDLLSQIVNEITSLNAIIKNQIYQTKPQVAPKSPEKSSRYHQNNRPE